MIQITISTAKPLALLVLFASPYSVLDAAFAGRDHYPGVARTQPVPLAVRL